MSRRRHLAGVVLTAVSLVLAVVAAAAWARSYARHDVLAYVGQPGHGRYWRLEVAPTPGLFACDLDAVELDMATLTEVPWELAAPGWAATSRRYHPGEARVLAPARRAYRLLDFSARHTPRIDGLADHGPAVRWERWTIEVPYWALVLGFAAPLLWRVRQRRLTARAADGAEPPAPPAPATSSAAGPRWRR